MKLFARNFCLRKGLVEQVFSVCHVIVSAWRTERRNELDRNSSVSSSGQTVVIPSPLTFLLLSLTVSSRSFGTRKLKIRSSSFLVALQKDLCFIPNRT